MDVLRDEDTTDKNTDGTRCNDATLHEFIAEHSSLHCGKIA